MRRALLIAAVGALFVVPAGEIVSMVALILIVWLLSSSSWPEAYQTLLAGAFGLLLYAVFARRERRTPI